MKTDIGKWVNLKSYPLSSIDFTDKCRQKLSDTGVLLLPQFLLPEALNQTIKEALARAHLAYFTKNTHNVYLSEPNTSLPEDHVFNRQVKSSKGCITTDQIQLICSTEKQFDMVNDIFNKNKTELIDVEIWDEGKNQKWIVTYQIAGNSTRILN